MNEQISVDPGLITSTLASARNTEKQKPGKAKVLYRRPIVIAAAFALCLVLAAPVMASNIPAIYQLMYLVSPETAQFFVPVQKACEDNGIRMEVVSTNIHDNTVEIYITLQDLTGDRVDETTDLFDSYTIHRAFNSSASCEYISYEADTKTATFLIRLTEWGNHEIAGSKLTFSVREFISHKTVLEDVPVDIDLAQAVEAAETQTVKLIGSGGPNPPENSDGLDRSNVLVPQSSICSPVKGLDVTAIGFVDGKLHIQMVTAEKQTLDNHGYFYLTDQAGNRIDYDYSVSFAEGLDRADRIDYQEFVFAVSKEQIEYYTLYGSFYTSGLNTKGNWRVTFPLQR